MKNLLFWVVLLFNPISCKDGESDSQAFHSDEDGRNKGIVDTGVYVDARKTRTLGEIATTQYSNGRWTGDKMIDRTSSGYSAEKHLNLSKDGAFYFKAKAASVQLAKLPQKIEIIKGIKLNKACSEIGYESLHVNSLEVCTAIDEVVRLPRHKKNASIFLLAVKPMNGEIRVRLTWPQVNGQESVVFDITVLNLIPSSKNSINPESNNGKNSYVPGSDKLFLSHVKQAEVRQGLEKGKPTNLMSGEFFDESELGYRPVTYSQLTDDESFWKGCQSCVNFQTLQSKSMKNCLCTAMVFDPQYQRKINAVNIVSFSY